MPGELEEDWLDLQVAFVVLSALQSAAPLEHLAGRTQHHNLVECKSGSAGPCSFLLCFSNPTIHFTCNKAEHKQQPTLYLAIAATRSALPCPSLLCNFLCGQRFLDTGLAPGAKVQAAAAQVIEEMPVQLLLNYLGQGFKVVLVGQCFGGLVAHTLAARLLLQVQQEITLAQKMGINLSALSQTKDKVVSFGFGVPFFAGSQLQKHLHDSQLDHNLHSFWHQGDGSLPFLTYASELAAAHQHASHADQAGEEDEEPDTFGGDESSQGPNLQLVLSPGPHTAALDQCATTLGQALEPLQGARKLPNLVCSSGEGAIFNAAMARHRAQQLTKGGPGSRSFNSQDECDKSQDSPKSLSQRPSHTELHTLPGTPLPELNHPIRSVDRRPSQSSLKRSLSKELEAGPPLKPSHSLRTSLSQNVEGVPLKPPHTVRPSPSKESEGPPLASSKSMGPAVTGRDMAHHSSPAASPMRRASSIAQAPASTRAQGVDAAQRRHVLNIPPSGHAPPSTHAHSSQHSSHQGHRSMHRDPTAKTRNSSSGTGIAPVSELEPKFGRMSMSETERHTKGKLMSGGAGSEDAHPRTSRHSLPQLPSSSPKVTAGPGSKKNIGSEPQGESPKQPSKSAIPPWRQALDAFFELSPTKLNHHAPIGQFWIIEQQSDSQGSAKSPSAPGQTLATPSSSTSSKSGLRPSLDAKGQTPATDKAGSKPAADAQYAGPVPLVKLSKTAPSEVMDKAAKWLLPSNKELLSLWEQSLPELEKDLMEVFPWFIFSSTITTSDSSVLPRQKAMRLTALHM